MSPVKRALLEAGQSYDALRAGFCWRIPTDFSISEACCDSWARTEPDRLALIDLSADGSLRHWRYGELAAASNRLANAFAARGLRRGDTVAVLLPQGPEVLITHFAAMKLGAIVLPLFTLFGLDALAYRLADARARVVVTNGASLEKLGEIRGGLADLRDIYCIEPSAERDFWGEIERASDRLAPVPVGADEPAVLIYTSGTTGAPKGVVHAHRFLLGHLPNIELSQGFFPKPGAVGWTPADWAWIGGLMDMAMPCLYYGVPLISRRMRKFDPDEAFGIMRHHRVTNLFLPPTALKLMRGASVPGGLCVRAVSSGGESLGAEMLEWGRSALNAPINEIYGQTECNLVVCSAEGLFPTRPGTMGRAVPGAEVAVLDAEGRAVADGEIGEIAIRRGNPVMFLEYMGKPEATAAKFTGEWLRTGDLGIRDEEGYFTYVARDDDIISSAGYRIGPSEIENCLTGHPDVVMAACVGVPDAVRGEVVKAFVVLRERADWEGLEAALIQRVKDRVSPHVAPRWVERRESLPMTATGKIMRRELRDA
ncbi:AMP-binding protein [Defluviimonas sp. WL0050]|uniref:AMP-binding protein n=1 Tax=Albidovulum litorale TaxID=2984134 RepID=A0ABT2ZJV3_9RHOB|nr:AMP-binding protein [Defluviimonas sp. WL0050]MCV2871036.1 AMP-binding protein [Defluviimonas sp. WL0050]